MEATTVKARPGGRIGRWRRNAAASARVARARRRRPATVPAAALRGVELIHLGGGETLPCPDAEGLPLDAGAGRAGLGTSRLALPPARVHVLGGATIHPASGVVVAADGRIVAESIMNPMSGRATLERAALRSAPIDVAGTWAVFRTPPRSTYHTLVDELPRAGLLIHPALARLGPLTVLHDGPLGPLERGLLAHLGSRRVSLRQVEGGRPIRPERVVLPNFVTRYGAGAVPSWYRRWCDGVVLPRTIDAPRRIHLDPGVTSAQGHDDAALRAILEHHDITTVDPGAHDPMELLGILRDADLVIGRAHEGLAGCLFSRRTHVVELLDGLTLDPAIYYLAASKGLPYDYVPTRTPPEDRRSGEAAGVGVGADADWLDRLLTRIG